MTNKQVDEINKIVQECRHRQQGICRMQVLPCGRAIDRGICPEIIDYLQKHKTKSEEWEDKEKGYDETRTAAD